MRENRSSSEEPLDYKLYSALISEFESLSYSDKLEKWSEYGLHSVMYAVYHKEQRVSTAAGPIAPWYMQSEAQLLSISPGPESDIVLFYDWLTKQQKTVRYIFLSVEQYWRDVQSNMLPEDYLEKQYTFFHEIVNYDLAGVKSFIKGTPWDMYVDIDFGGYCFKRGIEDSITGYILDYADLHSATYDCKTLYSITRFANSFDLYLMGRVVAFVYKFLRDQKKRLSRGEDITTVEPEGHKQNKLSSSVKNAENNLSESQPQKLPWNATRSSLYHLFAQLLDTQTKKGNLLFDQTPETVAAFLVQSFSISADIKTITREIQKYRALKGKPAEKSAPRDAIRLNDLDFDAD